MVFHVMIKNLVKSAQAISMFTCGCKKCLSDHEYIHTTQRYVTEIFHNYCGFVVLGLLPGLFAK